jgi:anti-sigma B factor antagonist
VAAITGPPAEVDMATVGPFREELRAAIRERRGESVWVDLSGVTFMDSVGLGVLVGSRKYALGWGGDLFLVAPSRPVMMLLRVSGLDRMLPIDLEASVRAVGRAA